MEKMREEVEKWRCDYQQLQISTVKEKEEALDAAVERTSTDSTVLSSKFGPYTRIWTYPRFDFVKKLWTVDWFSGRLRNLGSM